MIRNKQEFRNYLLGIMMGLNKIINFEPTTEDDEEVIELYNKLYWFINNDCTTETNVRFNRTSFEYKGKTYPAVEVFNFTTADDELVDYGIFADLDFMDSDGDCLEYRMFDDRIYGYLPKSLIQNGTEYEIREYIKNNIG